MLRELQTVLGYSDGRETHLRSYRRRMHCDVADSLIKSTHRIGIDHMPLPQVEQYQRLGHRRAPQREGRLFLGRLVFALDDDKTEEE